MTDKKQALPYGIGVDAAIDAIMSGENVFITGGGGTGKSHIINTIRQFFKDDTLFIAPTGLAALNIRGMSCHKALGLSLGVTQDKDLRSVRSNKQAELMTSKALSRIVIDEVSMARSDKIYEMDMKLRYFRKCDKPFGGLQVIVLGDGFQLAAVLTRNEEPLFRDIYGSEIPFGCWSWMECKFRNVILLVGHRQDDKEFLEHLNNIRLGINIPEAVKYMNEKCFKDKTPDPDAVTLCTTNKIAEEMNKLEYDKLQGTEQQYRAKVKGDFKERPIPEVTNLKVGAKVLITANDPDNEPPHYVNGTTGTVVSLTPNFIKIDVGDKNPVIIEEKVWDNIEYAVEPVLKDDGTPALDEQGHKIEIIKEKKLGTYTAFPVKLAYALTIHKAQGLTLQKLRIDLGAGGAFTPGQAYVALSRATSVDGLQLVRPLRVRDIIVDSRIVSFYNYTFPNLPKGGTL